LTEVSGEALGQINGLTEEARAESCETLVNETGFTEIGDSTGWAEDQSSIVLDTWSKGFTAATGQDPADYLAKYKAIIEEQTEKIGEVPLEADSCLGYIE
jgi:hypothetical protein